MSEVKKESKTKKSTTKKAKEEKEVKVKKTATKVKEEKKTSVKKVAETKKVKEEVLLNDRDQVTYRALSKVIKIIAKICKIVLMVFVPFIFLAMIIIPIVFNDYQISGNIIRVNDVNLIVNDDKLTIKVGDEVEVVKCDAKALDLVTSFLTENSKASVFTFIELTLLLFAIVLIAYIYMFSYMVKLFDNFANKDTPFISENSNYILRIAVIMIAIKFIQICLNTANLSYISFETTSIIGILIIFVIYFIFKYAVNMQAKNDTKNSK